MVQTRLTGFYVSTPCQNSNSAVDFLQFVVELLVSEVLVPGDFFVVDNSPVHYAIYIAAALDEVLALNGVCHALVLLLVQCSFVVLQVTLVFLPCYSPELNPCENVFGLVKRWLREHAGRDSLLVELQRAFPLAVNREFIANAYMKVWRLCIGD